MNNKPRLKQKKKKKKRSLTDEFNISKFFPTLVTKFGLTMNANHMIAAFSPLYVNFTFGAELSVLLTVVNLARPILEHTIAFSKLIARNAVMPRRLTLKTPDQLAFRALHFC